MTKRTGNTSRNITARGGADPSSETAKTQQSEDPADDADPRRVFYNSLMKLQAKPPVRVMMRKIPEGGPMEIAISSSRPDLALLLTPSGFQLRLGKELVGFFELPMFKAPREGLDGFDYEAIHQVVMKRAEK